MARHAGHACESVRLLAEQVEVGESGGTAGGESGAHVGREQQGGDGAATGDEGGGLQQKSALELRVLGET